MSEVLLIGNGLAVLVAAVELGQRGQSVTVLTDGKPMGGHFAGIQIDGHDFDIGMVMIEQVSSGHDDQDLRTYTPSIRNDWTRFGGVASRWIRQQVELVRVPTPASWLRGQCVPDYLISNRLEAFVGAQAPIVIPRNDPHHPVHKCEPGLYDTLSYAQAARLNHGDSLHQQFIEPFVEKMLGVSSEAFLARYHRAAWVPLFYPETLGLATRAQAAGLDEYPFWTTASGFVGQLVRDLRAKLTQMPCVKMLSDGVQSLKQEDHQWVANLSSGESYISHRVALGVSAERACGLLGVCAPSPGVAASITVQFAKVKSTQIGRRHTCTMVLDDEFASYRLTDQDALAGLDPEWHRVTLEASPQRLAKQYPNLSPEDALKAEIISLFGIPKADEDSVQLLKCITAREALVLPTSEQVMQASTMAKQLAQAAPGVVLTGTLLGYGVASLNDQIVQGLKISKEFA